MATHIPTNHHRAGAASRKKRPVNITWRDQKAIPATATNKDRKSNPAKAHRGSVSRTMEAYARSIPRWRAMGYHVKIIFLSLPTVEIAVERVAARVAQGGHDVPETAIRRRFKSGFANFHRLYCPLVDAWALYDNSGAAPVLLEWGERK